MPSTDSPQLITTLPLTAEARERLLDSLFSDDLPHHGELFVPGHSFYIRGTSHAKARHMVKNLCAWLGIKPGYIGLEFESQPDLSAQGQHHNIFLESRVLRDELLLGATIAHALTRYLLEQRKQVHLIDPNEQLSVVATGTIVFGLGVVTANGLRPDKAHKNDIRELLGTLPIHEYVAMLHGFLWQRAVPEHAYQNSLAPWAAKLLDVPKPKKPIEVVRQQYHYMAQKRFERIGLLWIILLGLCIGGFVFAQRVKPTSNQVKSLQEKTALLHELRRLCSDTVAYTRQYADMGDLQTVRNVNAEELRCKSLDNQLSNAEQELKQAN